MKFSGEWLENPATQALCRALDAEGAQALFVGGCVRNALLGAAVADIDLATDAIPARVIEIAEKAGFRAIPTGIDHGTVTVIVKGVAHEITTFRRDVETDGRHATVAFSTHIEEDAARRDFTMNALYARADGTVLDPLNGLPDLEARRVRFVGDPQARIIEDYLRILRYFRFHAWYGDPVQGLDPDALAAIAEHAQGLEGISRERIGHEMRKLLAAPDPAPALAAMQACGVLNRVLPGADSRAIAPLVHIEADLPPSWLRRLTALGGLDAADALRLSRQEAKALKSRQEAMSLGLSEAAWRLGADAARDGVLALSALMTTPPPDGWQAKIQGAAAAQFPIKAEDLPPNLIGPAIGAALKQLTRQWIASDFRASKAELLAGLATN